MSDAPTVEAWCCISYCENAAEYTIINATQGADPYDYTHACTRHVGDLLGSINDVKATEWQVLKGIV